MAGAPITTYTVRLTDIEAKELQHYLNNHDFEFVDIPYTRFAARKGRLNLAHYQSGKLVLQGRDTQEFVEFVLEPLILKRAELGYEHVHNPELLIPRIGVDESGKGDFFGPLCIAAVYGNEKAVEHWREQGMKDSKSISDTRIPELAKAIRKTPGALVDVVVIGNEAYNRLYRKVKNLNDLLAWGHARAVENLLEKKDKMQPPPQRIISDQFAANPATVAKALQPLGRRLELIQRPKAESDPVVAAASILARDRFLDRLSKLGEQWGAKLPKGASVQVQETGRHLIEKHGAPILEKVAKTHFRTAGLILGEERDEDS